MARSRDKRPNFVLVLTDDQGYGDLSCMGATDFATPHLDRLAEGGTRFTNWYSNSPVCSPSRAALLTGRYPVHAGVRSILGGHRRSTGLPPEVPTIASALKQEGYRTAHAGKWHVGAHEDCRPHRHGFDEWFGSLAGCVDYFSHIFYWCMPAHDPVHDLWDNNREVWHNGRYFTELVTERAVDFIRRASREDEPFLLYVAYTAPHYPMHAPQQYLDRFPDLPWDRGIMAAMLSAVDDGVGEIVRALERSGERDNTCIFFTSDNGPSRESRNWLDCTPDPYYGGSAGKLKGHKFSLYDGGIRMPAILNWPVRVPGGRVVDKVGVSMDVFPTFLSAAGGDSSRYELDGCDVLAMAADGAATPHEAVFWEMGQQTAVRKGKWKLVLNGQLVEGAPPEDDVHLADLDADMGEKTNLRDTHPDVTAELKAEADYWRARIDRHWETVWQDKAVDHRGVPDRK